MSQGHYTCPKCNLNHFKLEEFMISFVRNLTTIYRSQETNSCRTLQSICKDVNIVSANNTAHVEAKHLNLFYYKQDCPACRL